VIVLEDNRLVGMVTDGDLRRAMQKYDSQFFSVTVNEYMSVNPKTISTDSKLIEAEAIMNDAKINMLVVLNGEYVQGVIQIFDIQ